MTQLLVSLKLLNEEETCLEREGIRVRLSRAGSRES